VPRQREALRGLALCLPAVWLASAACAGGIETGLPLEDPDALARRAMERRGAQTSTLLRFGWRYGDRQGQVSGDGVARFTPTDSIRLDLFAPGDLAMAVALTDAGLSVLGEIEDVELPPMAFLYAMAGIFRPGDLTLVDGYEGKDRQDILVYRSPTESLIYYFVRPDLRLSRVEEQMNGRTRRRLNITWPDEGEPTAWPQKAEYRDYEAPNRVRWDLESSEEAPAGFPPAIYELSA
jgi:hypothetical protein